MTDEEFIAATRDARKEAVRFFSAEAKPERERWVAVEFLTNLGMKFEAGEVLSSQTDPPDIVFRDAAFEIKEIMDVGKKRHDEYKEALRRAEQARTVGELFEAYTPKDVLFSDATALVVA